MMIETRKKKMMVRVEISKIKLIKNNLKIMNRVSKLIKMFPKMKNQSNISSKKTLIQM